MITMDDAYSWLNVGDVSHLTAANNLSLFQIEDRMLPEQHREAIIKTLRVACESSNDILETLEMKCTLAKTCFASGDYAAAKMDLFDAVERYRPASHRLAVARWMLGILLWTTHDNDAAYSFWSGAKEIFITLAQDRIKNHDIVMVNWYHQKISDMRLELVLKAEEAYYWLNYFDASHISDQSRLIAVLIKEKIQKKEYPLAYEIGLNLARTSRNRIDTMETAEAWVIIGLAALQMGNPRLAIDYLQRGASGYTPWGHKQAVTRWMIGIAQWQIPQETDQAIKNWTNAVEAFRGLAIKFDKENDPVKKDWYQANADMMQKALSLRISGALK